MNKRIHSMDSVPHGCTILKHSLGRSDYYYRTSRRSLRHIKEEKEPEKDVENEPALVNQNKKKKGGFLGFIDKIFTRKSSKSSPTCLHSKNTSLKNQNNQKIQEDFKSL